MIGLSVTNGFWTWTKGISVGMACVSNGTLFPIWALGLWSKVVRYIGNRVPFGTSSLSSWDGSTHEEGIELSIQTKGEVMAGYTATLLNIPLSLLGGIQWTQHNILAAARLQPGSRIFELISFPSLTPCFSPGDDVTFNNNAQLKHVILLCHSMSCN